MKGRSRTDRQRDGVCHAQEPLNIMFTAAPPSTPEPGDPASTATARRGEAGRSG